MAQRSNTGRINIKSSLGARKTTTMNPIPEIRKTNRVTYSPEVQLKTYDSTFPGSSLLGRKTYSLYSVGNDPGRKKVLPPNIQEFLHFLEEKKVNDDIMEYMFSLRNENVGDTLRRTQRLKNKPPAHPPSFFDEDLDSYRKKRRSHKDYSGHPMDVIHMLKHRGEQQLPPKSISFQAGLRSYKSQAALGERRPFSTIPYKPKKELINYPRYLPPVTATGKSRMRDQQVKSFKALLKTKDEEEISAFEGGKAFGKFDIKLKSKNYNQNVHLIKGGGGSISIGSLKWATGLRNI